MHNACRSQIAEAFGHKLAGDVFESFSAGTQPAVHIHPDALRLMDQLYGTDMTALHYGKHMDGLPKIDVAVTMGCNVNCGFLPCQYREDWGIQDPSGQEDAAFLAAMGTIEQKVKDLRSRILTGKVVLHT